MSAIQKKPYIRNVLDSMEDEEKVTLLQLVDGKQNKPTPKSLINPSLHITGADKLLTPEYIALEAKDGVHTGYLIYNDDYCTLVSYEDGSQGLRVMDIDLSTMTYSVNQEDLTIADFRFEIEESKEKMDVVDYIKEALEEGQIVIDGGALVVSLSNVNLSTGTASAALSSDDFAIAADEDKPCVLQMGLSTQSVWPVGDLVELNRISVVANTSATFAGVVNGCVINAVFTSGAGTVTIKNDGARIVEITGTIPGIQTEEMAAKILAADALWYPTYNYMYWKSVETDSSVKFYHYDLDTSNDAIKRYGLEFNKSNRNLTGGAAETLNVLRREITISGFSSSVSYTPGDLVYRNQNVYRCVNAHNGAWDATHFTQTILADEISTALKSAGDIVTITAEGVQSDEMAAKIEAAKAVYYDNRFYGRILEGETTITFKCQEQSSSLDTYYYITYTKSSKSISNSYNTFNRVASFGGKNGAITTDGTLETNSSKVVGLTGQLPYLTTEPSDPNTAGFVKLVVLDDEPSAYKEGYLYFISEPAE